MSPEDRSQLDEIHAWELLNTNRSVAPEYEPGDAGYGPELCKNDDCEAEMPELRRRRGCRFCTDCQSRAEYQRKRGY